LRRVGRGILYLGYIWTVFSLFWFGLFNVFNIIAIIEKGRKKTYNQGSNCTKKGNKTVNIVLDSPSYEEVAKSFNDIEAQNLSWEELMLKYKSSDRGLLRDMIPILLAKKAKTKSQLNETLEVSKSNPGAERMVNAKLHLGAYEDV